MSSSYTPVISEYKVGLYLDLLMTYSMAGFI